MLVSIIIPCYNYGHLLRNTLISIQNQNYKNWEAIIIDDGSSDNTKQIAEEFTSKDSRYKYLYQKNSGLSTARNTGILNAKGDLFQFLDADDLLSKEKLRLQVDLFRKRTSLQLCFTAVKFFYLDESNSIRYFERYKKGVLFDKSLSHYDLLKRLVTHNFTVVNSPLVARNLIEKVGYFDSELHANEDWDYWFRCALICSEFIYCDNEDTGYALVRAHPGSMSTNMKQMANAEIFLRFKFTEYLKTVNYDVKELFLLNSTKIAFLNYVFVKVDDGIKLYTKLLKTENSKRVIFKSLFWATGIKCKLLISNRRIRAVKV